MRLCGALRLFWARARARMSRCYFLSRISAVDFKPVPPDGKVYDLRNQGKVKTTEEVEQEKKERHEKMRRNLRLVAIVLAIYYFASAGYSWYQESQLEQGAIVAQNMANPLANPQDFRNTFNSLINAADTSLPTANANDTPEGFIAVLSTAVEMQGYAKPNSKELQSVQIQTRYPDAFPPESLVAFENFILACERMADPNATMERAHEVMNNFGLVPALDANPDDKNFEPTVVQSVHFEYRTTFNAGPIDELTLVATPIINLMSVPQGDVPALESASSLETGSTDVPAVTDVTAANGDVPAL